MWEGLLLERGDEAGTLSLSSLPPLPTLLLLPLPSEPPLLVSLDDRLAEPEASRLACFARCNSSACFATLPPRLMERGTLLPCLDSCSSMIRPHDQATRPAHTSDLCLFVQCLCRQLHVKMYPGPLPAAARLCPWI